MLMMTKQSLTSEATKRGYRAEILEKVYRLLALLNQFMAVKDISSKLVLKGGTAINLFCTEELPRLSVDLDFNYVGALDRKTMLIDRVGLEALIIDVCQRTGYTLHRNPSAHAGGKMVLVYDSVLGNKGRLEIDLNYLFRVPLWQPTQAQSPQWLTATTTHVLDTHELAAGKLHALLGRQASRDLFDAHQLLTTWKLDTEKLRLAFTVYAAMERDNWQLISVNNIQYTVKEIRDKLIPVLNHMQIPGMTKSSITTWAKHITDECREAFSRLLPFNNAEVEFLEQLQSNGVIKPEIISDDAELNKRVRQHPSLLWRAAQI